jgi:carbon-monoxide dehydrogenase large subunit
LPAVINVEQAVQPEAPKIWPDCPTGNIAVTIAFGDKAATAAVLANAKHVVSVRLVNNRITGAPIEPRCSIGVYEAAHGRYTLYTTTQDPHGLRTILAADVLHVPETRVKVISPDVGGGFGTKGFIYPDDTR